MWCDLIHESHRVRGRERLLPDATSFTTGRVSDAIREVYRGGGATTSGGTSTSGTTDCGGGVSVNEATSCPFGQNVADEYRASGGATVIEVFSPVTGRSYTMTCTGAGPVVCRGGNNAAVYIR